MADGNPAIWAAARQVWPEAAEQRCWNHKILNVLDRLPKREQAEAKKLLRAVAYAPTRAKALAARQAFQKRYGAWYPKAVAERRFRRLDAPHLLADVYEGRKFQPGQSVLPQPREVAA